MTSTSHDDTSNQAVQNAQTRKVTFEVKGAPLSGTLYPPKDFEGKPRAVVVVTGAWTAVEEQMPANYARELVKHGLAAFTFDFRGWGKSGDLEGGVRFVENPAAKTADIRAAFECVAALPEVDAAHIFGLGICASAGYMVDAVAGNPLVSRIALIAPWLQDKDIVNAVYGGDEGVAALIETSRKAEAAGGEIIPAAGPLGADGVLMPVGGYYYEAQRGAIPQYDNKWNNAGWEGWLTYYPADNPERLDKPLAVVHSQSAAIPDGVRKFLQGYGGAPETLWLENVEQFDFYDAPANISRATDFVARHYQSDLA